MEVLKEDPLESAGPRKESWPQKPLPDPVKLLPRDGAQVTLRGKPVTVDKITVVDGDIATKPGVRFYDAKFKIESGETVFDVYKTHHKLEELQ